MLLRSREIQKRRAPGVRRNDTEVDLQATRDDDRRLRLAVREHALDRRRSDQRIHHRTGRERGDEQIDITDRLAVAPKAPGDRDRLDTRLLAHPVDHRCRGSARVMHEVPAGALLQRGDGFQDVLLGLRLDLRQLAQAMRFRGLLELVDRRDPQVVVDDPGRRGPDARYAQERDEAGGHRGFELLVTNRGAGTHELDDRVLHRRTDLWDLPEAILLDERGDRLAQIADRARHRAIGDGAEDVLALQLEEIADLVKDRGDAFVVIRDGIAGHPAMLARQRGGRASCGWSRVCERARGSGRPDRSRRERAASSRTRPRTSRGSGGHPPRPKARRPCGMRGRSR